MENLFKMFFLWIVIYTDFPASQTMDKLCSPKDCLPDSYNKTFTEFVSLNCVCCPFSTFYYLNGSCRKNPTSDEKYYMKDKCKDTWSELSIKQQCEDDIDPVKDPLANVPVTNLRATYKNIFCAVCNEDRNVSFWEIRIVCEKNEINIPEIKEHLYYDYASGLWRLKIHNNNSQISFENCRTKITPPQKSTAIVDTCQFIIDNCSDTWADDNIKEQCMQNNFWVKSTNYIYKNVFCAVCNYVEINTLRCVANRMGKANDHQYDGYSILMDIDFTTYGNNVGQVAQCLEGEVFDPFINQCRIIICRENYELKNKKCELKVNNYGLNEIIGIKDSKCVQFLKLIEEIHFFDNHSMYLNTTKEIYQPGEYVIKSYGILICKSLHNKLHTDRCQDIIDLFVNVPYNEKNAKDIYAYKLEIYNRSNTLEILCDPLYSQEENTTQIIISTCVSIKLEKNDFTLFENGTLIRKTNKKTQLYKPGEYYIDNDQILICVSNNDGQPMTRYLWYVTVTCLSASLFCLLLHFVIYLIFSEFHNLPGKNLASLVVALFFAQLFFIVSFVIQPLQTSCQIIGILMHFCYLASFSWKSAIGFDMWQAFSLYDGFFSKDQKSIKFIQYSFFAWGLPLIVVGLAVITDEVLPFSDFHPKYGDKVCWISQRKSLLVFFALPVAFLLLINIAFFSLTAYNISRTLKCTQIVHKERKSCCSTYAKLLIVMGLTWVLGFLSAYIHSEPLTYLFTVVNSLQGVFIFIAFTCSKTSRKNIKDRTVKFFIVKSGRKQSCSSTKALTVKDSLVTKSSILSIESVSSQKSLNVS